MADSKDFIVYNKKGNLDDVAISDVELFRLEYMADNTVWIHLYLENRPDIVIWLGAEDKIVGTHEIDD